MRGHWEEALSDPEGSEWKIVTTGEDWAIEHLCEQLDVVLIRFPPDRDLDDPPYPCYECKKTPPEKLYGFYRICRWNR